MDRMLDLGSDEWFFLLLRIPIYLLPNRKQKVKTPLEAVRSQEDLRDSSNQTGKVNNLFGSCSSSNFKRDIEGEGQVIILQLIAYSDSGLEVFFFHYCFYFSMIPQKNRLPEIDSPIFSAFSKVKINPMIISSSSTLASTSTWIPILVSESMSKLSRNEPKLHLSDSV